MRAFDDRVLRGIFGQKNVAAEVRWAGHEEHMGKAKLHTQFW